MGVALGECDRAPSLRGHGANRIALVFIRDRLELAAGDLRPLEIARRNHDLDAGRQEPNPSSQLGGLGYDSSNPCRR